MAKDFSKIKPGDVIKVERQVIEGDKKRIQVIEGVVIAKKHGQEAGATITVRKIASGVGVEFVFPIHSPVIKSVTIMKRSKVRRAKLYYMRERTGKAGRMKEDQGAVIEQVEEKKPEEKPKAKAEKKAEKPESAEAPKKEEPKKEEPKQEEPKKEEAKKEEKPAEKK